MIISCNWFWTTNDLCILYNLVTCEQVEQATYGQSSGMDRRQVTEKQEYKDDDEFKWTIEKKIWKDSKQEINETKRKFSKDMRSKHVY